METQNSNKKDNNEAIDLSGFLDKTLKTPTSQPRFYDKNLYQLNTPGIVRWMMKFGVFIKTEKQATGILIVGSIFIIIVAFYLFFGTGKQKAPSVIPLEYKKILEGER